MCFFFLVVCNYSNASNGKANAKNIKKEKTKKKNESQIERSAAIETRSGHRRSLRNECKSLRVFFSSVFCFVANYHAADYTATKKSSKCCIGVKIGQQFERPTAAAKAAGQNAFSI